MSEIDDFIAKVSEFYQKYGIKSVTMDDVSRELGMSKKTLYSYVSNKDDLVERTLEYQFEKKKLEMKTIFDKKLNAIDELLEVNSRVVEMMQAYNPATNYDLRKYYPSLFFKYSKRLIENVYNSILDNINRGKKEGFFREELHSEIIAKIYISTLEKVEKGSGNEFSFIEHSIIKECVDEMMTYHIRGIANKKGIEYFESIMLEKKEH